MTVSVTVPVAVLDVVDTVRVEGVPGVTEPGLSEQVAPDGQPVTVSPTLPVNPLDPVTVTVEVPVPPCVSVSDVGLAEMEKFGTAAGLTVSVTLVE